MRPGAFLGPGRASWYDSPRKKGANQACQHKTNYANSLLTS